MDVKGRTIFYLIPSAKFPIYSFSIRNLCLIAFVLISVSSWSHCQWQTVDWEREHDGWALLCRNGVKCLQISQLEGKKNDYFSKSLRSHRPIFDVIIFTCRADLLSSRTKAASFKCVEAFFSPSAATTLARASRAASASAAMALWSCTGTRTSFISTRSTYSWNIRTFMSLCPYSLQLWSC